MPELKRLPLVVSPENRDDSTQKDSRLVNCYLEKTPEGEYWIYGRPGMLAASRPPGTNASGYGLFNWQGDIYSVFGTALYKNGTSVGTVNAAGGVYRFDSCLGATPKLQLGNGVAAYNYDSSGGLAQITDPDFPATFYKGWAYLNGTSYIMSPNAQILGSDINDPTAWNALNKIIAQIEPDNGVAMAKQLVYAIALKQWTTEVFYDAGNATGSPLGQVQGALANYGCKSADSVQNIEGALLWVSVTKSASPQVVMMENLKVSRISTAAIEKLLERADFGSVFSWQLKLDGHKFYVVTLKNENLTLSYDIIEQRWSQWTDGSGNYLPIVSSTYDSSDRHLVQHESNGRIYYMGADYLTDDSTIIVKDIYTPNFDGGTRIMKTLPIMEFAADQVVGSELLVRVNDFDYSPKRWTNFRRVDLTQQRPRLTECGSFSRRAWNFRHQSNTRFRLKAVDLTLGLGSS